jgi:hypothetical protein
MAVEELGGMHLILKWANSPIVFYFSHPVLHPAMANGRTERPASDFKVAKFPQLFPVSVHSVLHPAMAVEELEASGIRS